MTRDGRERPLQWNEVDHRHEAGDGPAHGHGPMRARCTARAVFKTP